MARRKFTFAESKRIQPDDSLWQQALEIHNRAIVIDTHSDLPLRMLDEGADIAVRREEGHQDLPRMREGGLDIQFLALYVAGKYTDNGALRRVLETYESVIAAVEKNPGEIGLAGSVSEAMRLRAQGKIAGVLALEGGHGLEGSLGALAVLQRLGVRYVTLTHIGTNELADASTDLPRWEGLSPFGRDVVREMNRLGMMVDVSHVSDAAFYDILEVSSAPVLATHSSARALAPIERNLTDDMIRDLARRQGVVQINFGTAFLDREWAERGSEVLRRIREDHGNNIDHWDAIWEELEAARPLAQPGLECLIDHIDHVVQLAGDDHVGLGSDYDGVDRVPSGVDDVSFLPNITFGLLKKGYTEASIHKILGGNVLRLWRQVEQHAAETAAR